MKSFILLITLNFILSLRIKTKSYDVEKMIIFVKRLGKLILNTSSSDLLTNTEKEKAYDECFAIFNDKTDYDAKSILEKFYDISYKLTKDILMKDSWKNDIFKNFIISKIESKSVIVGNRNIKCFDQFGEVNETNSPIIDTSIKALFAQEFEGLNTSGQKRQAVTSMFSVHRDTLDKSAFLNIYK